MGIPTCAISVACGLFLCGALPAAAEAITIVYSVTSRGRDQQFGYKYISPGRAEAWSGRHYGFITDSTGKKTRIDHAKREYTETTEEEDEAATRAVPRRPIYRGTPPDRSASFEKGPGRRTIAGYDCELCGDGA